MINLGQIKVVVQKLFELNELSIEATPISGGDIHQSYVLSLDAEHAEDESPIPDKLFAKLNSGSKAQVLESEFESLKLFHSLYPNIYPKALLYEQYDSDSVLLMDFHTISPLTATNAANAGHALATQHKITNDKFGWPSNNHIGLTPQSNQWSQDWAEFFRERRLQPMVELAKGKGLSKNNIVRVREIINGLNELLSHKVIPSLVHGDLWSGNLGFDQDSQRPLFYDPAPYYGDREIDIAMTELFGRLPDTFYQAYNSQWPIANGYEQRRAVYNLYHSLNHVVLFGLSYNSLVENCLDQIEQY